MREHEFEPCEADPKWRSRGPWERCKLCRIERYVGPFGPLDHQDVRDIKDDSKIPCNGMSPIAWKISIEAVHRRQQGRGSLRIAILNPATFDELLSELSTSTGHSPIYGAFFHVVTPAGHVFIASNPPVPVGEAMFPDDPAHSELK